MGDAFVWWWLTVVSCERHRSAQHPGQNHTCQPASGFVLSQPNLGATHGVIAHLPPFSSNWPAQPLSSDVPSPGLSHSILLPWSSRPPDHLPQSSQNSLLQWPVSMLTFFVPTQLRLCGRVCEALSASSLSHCVLLAGHLLSLQVLIARPLCPLSLWDPLPTSPSACPLGSKGASFLNTYFILHHFPLHDLKLWWSSNSLTSSAPFAVPAFPSRGQDMVHTAEHCLLVMVLALESHQLEPGGSDSLRAMTTSLAEALRILTNGVM